MIGSFSQDSINAFNKLVSQQSEIEFSEGSAVYNFAHSVSSPTFWESLKRVWGLEAEIEKLIKSGVNLSNLQKLMAELKANEEQMVKLRSSTPSKANEYDVSHVNLPFAGLTSKQRDQWFHDTMEEILSLQRKMQTSVEAKDGLDTLKVLVKKLRKEQGKILHTR
jgi:hypothetical protein